MKKTMLVLLGVGALDSAMGQSIPPTDLVNNLVSNGDFSQNICKADFCIYNTQNSVANWIPEPELEIGYGSIYSNDLTKERVLERGPNSNSCVKQVIPNVRPGCYELKFEWGARKNREFADSQFQVSMNG